MDGLIESSNSFGGNFASAWVWVDDHRVATSDHTDCIASNGGERVRHRRDCPDDTKRCMFDDGQAVITAEAFRFEELDARCSFAERLEFGDLVFKSTDLGLFHFHGPEFDTILDRDASDVVDDFLAVRDRAFSQLLEGGASGSYGVIDVAEEPKTSHGQTARCG